MLQLNPLCHQQLCWGGGRKLTHLCHIAVHILRRAITCVFTHESWGPCHPQGVLPLWKVFLTFAPLSPPVFQPQCSECLTLLSRVAAGPFPACPQSSSWEHISCPQSHRSYTYLLCRFKEQDAEAGSRGGWKNQQSHRV